MIYGIKFAICLIASIALFLTGRLAVPTVEGQTWVYALAIAFLLESLISAVEYLIHTDDKPKKNSKRKDDSEKKGD